MERMNDFFEARVLGYDAHMLENVPGCAEGYEHVAALLPEGTASLLDLGCGTGLELERIFTRFPVLAVTGIDLTMAMLQKLESKFNDKNLRLIHGSYFDVDFGRERYDTAVSFETMHHFTREKKEGLYAKLCDTLKPGGIYIECDYMVLTDEEENHWFTENSRIRSALGIAEEEFYHYDTPLTVDHQIEALRESGFSDVQMVWRKENTTILTARK